MYRINLSISISRHIYIRRREQPRISSLGREFEIYLTPVIIRRNANFTIERGYSFNYAGHAHGVILMMQRSNEMAIA